MNRRALVGGALALPVVALTRGLVSAEGPSAPIRYWHDERFTDDQWHEVYEAGWITGAYNPETGKAHFFLDAPNGIWVKTRPDMAGIMWVRSTSLPISYYQWEIVYPGLNETGPSWVTGDWKLQRPIALCNYR